MAVQRLGGRGLKRKKGKDHWPILFHSNVDHDFQFYNY